MNSTRESLVGSITVQPGTYGVNKIKQGHTLRIVDIEGGQVADFISMKFNDPTEYLDCAYTNMVNNRWRWVEGSRIYSNHLNPLWTITDDKTGIHFTGGGFCSNDSRRVFLDPKDETKGCRDCLEDALAEYEIEPHFLQSVSCFNVFMNLEYLPDGSWETKKPVTKAGDYIDLRAEMDMLWAISVCAWPFVGDGSPSPLRIEIYNFN
jgi:uncharacterized protein